MAGVGGLISLGERPPSVKEKKKKYFLLKCVDGKLSSLISCYPWSSANRSVLERIKLVALLCRIPPKPTGPCGNNTTLLPDQQSKEKKKQHVIY